MNIPATDIQNMTLTLTRVFHASRQKIFDAWTDPKMLTRWMGPAGVDTTSAEVDLRVGGKYGFTMQEADGQPIRQRGEYREIDPPSRLVFTWVLDGQGCSGSNGQYAETVVTIELEALGASTRLTLTHEFLPNRESRESHEMGWSGSFDCLEQTLSQ